MPVYEKGGIRGYRHKADDFARFLRLRGRRDTASTPSLDATRCVGV
jgi:hypothetical protein